MLSRTEIDAKCTKACNGICDMLKGHDGPCRSSNGYAITPVAVPWVEVDRETVGDVSTQLAFSVRVF